MLHIQATIHKYGSGIGKSFVFLDPEAGLRVHAAFIDYGGWWAQISKISDLPWKKRLTLHQRTKIVPRVL